MANYTISQIQLPNGDICNIKQTITGVKGNAETNYRTGNVNLTAANIGAVAKSGNETIAGNKTFEGVTILTYNSIYSIPTNTGIGTSTITKYLINNPFALDWHDLFAFCNVAVPKYYTSSDKTTWTEAPLDERIFMQQTNWGGINILADGLNGSRWEWNSNGFNYGSGYWLMLGILHSANVAKFDLLFESFDSSNNVTTLCSFTKQSNTSTPYYLPLSTGISSAAKIRLTITRSSEDTATTNNLPICALKLYSPRCGNQGKGPEYEVPYNWNQNQDIFPRSNNKSNLGDSNNKWAKIYATNFYGSGANLTDLPAGQLTGSIADARLSANVSLLNGNQTITGYKTFSVTPIITTNEMTFTGCKPYHYGTTRLPTKAMGLYANGIAISSPATNNDAGWVRMTGTSESDAVLEIGTSDDADNANAEKIVVSQYNSSTLKYQAMLLGKDGNVYGATTFPVQVTAPKFIGALEGNANTATTATNLSSAPSLAASGNNITVSAGGKTSSAFTVPYAAKAAATNISTTKDAIAKYSNTTGTFADSDVTIDDYGNMVSTHTAGHDSYYWSKYGDTLEFGWGIGSGNSNHGMYDKKAGTSGKWIILADATNNKWTFDGNAASASAVPLSGVTNADDLKAIEALTGTSGFLKKTAANTWSLDTNTYLTASTGVTSIAGKTGTVTLADLGLSQALRFIGITSTNLSDGATTSTLTAKSTGSLIKTTGFVIGDVVIDNNSAYEYIWTGSAWERLGGDSSYKTTQTTKTDPTASGTGIEYIASITQNANGEITATKSTVRSASETQSGVITTDVQYIKGSKRFLDTPTTTTKGGGWSWYTFGQNIGKSSKSLDSSNNTYVEYENKFSTDQIASIRTNLPYARNVYNKESDTTPTSTTYNNRPCITFRQYSVNADCTARTNYFEDYSLPVTDIERTNSIGYSILTTKTPVTVAQGGTGASTAANARTNLGLGSMATETATNYVKTNGANNMTGDLSIITENNDRFINFWYNTNKYAGASWRIGYMGSGSGENNDFVIQSGSSAVETSNTWKQHIQIKMGTGIVKVHRGLEILGHIAGDGDGATGHGASGGGGYHNAYNNLILHGDSSTGTSGILFMSDKVNEDTAVVTNINATTDRAFIQYHANGITTAAAEGTNPTLATSGEVGRLIVGIGNDSNDQIWLQTPSHTGLIHQIGNASYVIPDTNNASGSVGNSTLPVYVDSGIIKACSEPLIRYGTSSEAAATAAKTASIANFTLTSGVTVYIKFTNINSAATPTLNISSTGAKSITLPNGNKTPWDAGEVVSLTYDGTSWNINNYSKVEVIRL